MKRFKTKVVKIGNCPLGGSNPIRVQSMTNTSSLDIAATVDQTKRIFDAGADYVRISTPSQQSAQNLEVIKKELTKAGYNNPLVADIHFNASLALIAARLIEKIRINPGNYTGVSRKNKTNWTPSEEEQELDKIRENISPLVRVCKEYGTSIRVGTNFGSLSPRIVSQYGNTPEGMVRSTIEFLQILEDLNFDQTVISLKASSPYVTVRSCWLMVQKMMELGMNYPMHIGVTEAGEGEDGRIVSALGIGALLKAGIGDTVRVSLSEAPEVEIPVAIELVKPFNDFYSRQSEPDESYELGNFELQTDNLPLLSTNQKSIVVRIYDNLEAPKSLVATYLKGEPNAATPDVLLHKIDEGINNKSELVLPVKNMAENNFDSRQNNPVILSNLPLKENDFRVLNGLESPVILVPNQPSPKDIEYLWLDLKDRKIRASIIPTINPGELSETTFLNFAAISYGALLLQRKISGLAIASHNDFDCDREIKTAFGLLQAAGSRITNTQFISCPTCARTSFDMVEVVRRVKELAKGKPGLKIAVMGCIVNGPREMADADYGILGVGRNKVTIYKGMEPVIKNVKQGVAAELLVKLIG